MSTNGERTKIVLVHGTWGRGFNPREDAPGKTADHLASLWWFEAGSKFCEALTSGLARLGHTIDLTAFLWSGANSIEERRSASARLAETLDMSVEAAPNSPHFVIAHSHGGNVALEARRKMSGNASNLHIITLATPFLSIYQRTTRIADRIFAIGVSMGFALFAIFASTTSIAWAIGADAAGVFFGFSLLLWLFSILFGFATICSSAYRSIRRKVSSKPRSNTLNWAKRINNRALVTTCVLLSIGWFLFPHEDDMSPLLTGIPYLLALFVLPILLTLFSSISSVSKINSFFYRAQYQTPRFRQNIPNLTILRSERDEATLALLLAKFSSLLAQSIGWLTVVVPAVAAMFTALLLFFVIYLVYLVLHLDQACVSAGENCFDTAVIVFQTNVVLMGSSALTLLHKNYHYLVIGFCFCAILITLAAACKSFFGRELLYSPLNLIVDAYNTPGGSNSYRVDWCKRFEESAFGLRHSLYNNPDALEKIITRIDNSASDGAPREVSVDAGQPQPAPSKRWPSVAVLAFSAGFYTLAVLVLYAPPGATTSWCALKSHFESSGAKGEFTVLVARLENDLEGAGDRLKKEIAQQYGLKVIQTCIEVTTIRDDGSSAEELPSKYNSGLLVWGTLTHERQVQLRLRERGGDQGYTIPTRPIAFPETEIADFVANELRRPLIRTIERFVRYDISRTDPPSNLASFANWVDGSCPK